jgi:hypothetical protein
MSNDLNRFAVSLLSRKHKEYAVPNELMIHREIGQILIKTVDGDVISHDSLARLQHHVDTVTNNAKLYGVNGDLFSMEFDDFELPEIVAEDINLLGTPVLLKSGASKVLISIDLDNVIMAGYNQSVDEESTATIIVNFKRTKTDGSIENNRYTISKKISSLNTLRIEPQNYLPTTVTDYNQYSTVLESLIIKRNSKYTNDTDIRNIIHSVLVAAE